MIYCLTGKILKKTLDTVVISCAGVGYAAQVPTTTAEALPAAGHEATLYTVLSVSENDVALYGFASEDQRACFKLLTSVSGVGPKAGLAILSILTPEKVALAASSGDHKAFTAASGVGPKLAQRIALELKDKVGKGLAAGTGFAAAGTAAPPPASAPPRRWPRWSASATRRRRLRWPSPVSTIRCRCRTSSRSPCAGCPVPGAEPPAALHP